MRPPRPADDEHASPSRFGAALTRLRRRRQEWHLRVEHSEELLDDHGLRLEDWIANGAATVVKQGVQRAVYRLALPSGNHYLKQYRLAGPRTWLQNNLRPCRAHREAAGITKLSAVGIRTAELVAVGRATHGPFSGESFVLTRELPQAFPLDEWMRTRLAIQADGLRIGEIASDGSLRRRVIEQLASLTASLHRHGLVHADFHAGNVLVQCDGDGMRLFLIDLLPLRTAAMTAKRRWSMLGMLATSLSPHASRADHRRFLNAYSTSLGVHDDPRTVEAFCAAEVARRQRRADRKWRRGNRHVVILDAGDIACRGLAEMGRETLVAWRNAIARGEAASLPKTATLRRLPSGSAAREAWENGHALLRRGMPVARPLMFLEKRNGGIIVRDGAMPCATLPEWLRHASEGVCRVADHVETLAAVGRLLRRLDDAGFITPPDAIAVSADGRVTIDRPEQVIRRTIWRPRREDSLRRTLSTISSIADRTSVETGYRGTTARPAESTTEHRSVVRRRVPFQRAAAALLLAIATVVAGCRSFERAPPVAELPAKHSVRADQLMLISDFKLERDDPLVKDLIDLREQVVSTLQLPEPRQDVVVYMFSNEDAYRRYLEMVHPGLPSRRAYFVGTKKELAVYTYWGDRIQEDLRHEYTHGILHSSLAAVPLWLDEGLAEYFEVAGLRPGGMNGDYPHQLAVAVANGWRPDIDRLEQVEEFSQLRRIDYQESWAWVHYLLHASPDTRQELLAYVSDLRDSTRPQSLSDRIATVEPGYPSRFLGYVATLNSSGGAVIRAASEL